MSSLVISGDTSGTVTVAAPAVAGSNTLTLQAGTGTNSMNTLSTAVTLTTQTSVDFTSIPSWVKRITVMFSVFSTASAGTSGYLIQLGDSGGIENTGYSSSVVRIAATNTYGTSTAGFIIAESVVNTNVYNGIVTLTLIGSNNWAQAGTIGSPTASNATNVSSGSKTLSDTLTQLRITTVGGTDTFDAGTINILYEG